MGKPDVAYSLIRETDDSKITEWQLDLLRYHQNKLGESELISKARHKGELCEAYYYIAYQYFLKSDKTKAINLFRKAVEPEAFGYTEYIEAQVRLQQMETK